MEKNEKRAVIKYLNMKGLSPQQIHEDMKQVLVDNTPSQTTVYRWVAELKWGRQSTEDEHRTSRPVEACTNENVEFVQDMIPKDR